MEQPPPLQSSAFATCCQYASTWCWQHFPSVCTWFIAPHGHAHLVFVEMCFGLNIVFAFYEELRGYIRRMTEKEIANIIEALTAFASDSPPGSPVRTAVIRTRQRVDNKVDETHRWQETLTYWGIRVAIAFAFLSTMLVFLDLVDWLNWWCFILVLPFPSYWFASTRNYRKCLAKCNGEMAELYKVKEDFLDPADLPGGNGD